MPVELNFHYAFYAHEGKALETAGGRPLPVDFRIKPRDSGIPTGASNIIVEVVDKEELYLLTCAHALYIWDDDHNGKLGESFSIKPYASARTFGPYEGKKWDFDEAPDVGIIKIDNFSELVDNLKIKLEKLDINRQAKKNDHVAVATSLARTRSRFGGQPLTITNSIAAVKQQAKDNDKMKELFGANAAVDFKDLLSIDDTVATGDSGSAVFSKDYKHLHGIILMDDEEHNYVSKISEIVTLLQNHFQS